MFNLSNDTVLPKISNVLNNSSLNPARVFTEPWILFMGGWFFALVIGALSGALYIKYENALVPIVFFVICSLLLSPVMPDGFIGIVGIIAGFAIGFLLYKLYVKEE